MGKIDRYDNNRTIILGENDIKNYFSKDGKYEI
jgi:hypothetical protein